MLRNIWLVTKHDVGVILRQRSFWFLTFLMPLLLLAINTMAVVEDNDLGENADGESSETEDTTLDFPPIGLVDEAGLIADYPPGFPENIFLPYESQDIAQQALDDGKIGQFVLIAADYVGSGTITVYAPDFQIRLGGEGDGVAFDGPAAGLLNYLLEYNLIGDPQLLLSLREPLARVEVEVLAPPAESDDQNDLALALVVASITPYIFYFLLLMGSSYLLRSVVAEKENRTVEVLLLSLEPRELLSGKILAMTLILLVQMAFWVGGGIVALDRGADLLRVTEFSFPPGFIFWAFLFLVTGYMLYAAVMTAAGAISSNAREGNQMIWVLIIPLMPTLMFGQVFVESPHGTMALVLSMFPLSAPSAMVTRLAIADVPLWQVLVSLGGLMALTAVMLNLAGRFFRAGNLLSGASFSWRRITTAWRE